MIKKMQRPQHYIVKQMLRYSHLHYARVNDPTELWNDNGEGKGNHETNNNMGGGVKWQEEKIVISKYKIILNMHSLQPDLVFKLSAYLGRNDQS